MDNFAFRKTITFKVSFIIAGIVLLLFMLLTTTNYFISKNDIYSVVHINQKTQAHNLARDIDNKINQRLKFIQVLAQTIQEEIPSTPEALESILAEYTILTNYFNQGFVIINPNGIGCLAEYPVIKNRKNLTFTESQWFRRAVDESGAIISSPFLARYSDQPILAMAIAIRNKSGKLFGVLATPLELKDPEFMGHIYDKNFRRFGDILVISRPDETFVGSSNENMVLTRTPETGKNLLHDRAMAGFNGVGTTINSHGVEEIVAIVDLETQDWFVVVRTPINIALKLLRERLTIDITLGFIFAILTVVSIFIALSIYFAPLKHAAQSVREMGRKGLHKLPQKTNDEIGDLICGFNTLTDVVKERTTELEQKNIQLHNLSRTDGLTKIYNRRWFDHILRQSWKTHQRSKKPLSLIILDIDWFKQYNDLYGHLEGDNCLLYVATALNETLRRPTDLLARYGGEEFVAIVENDREQAFQLAELMHKAILDMNMEHRNSPFGIVTVSVGVATIIPAQELSTELLIKYADHALYRSKEKGRNRIEVYDQEHH
ncbi:MAG: diguanylate cyclase [Desulfovibrio sp.]